MTISGQLRVPCLPYVLCVCVCDDKMTRALVILELVSLSSYCYLADIWKFRNTYRIAVGDSVG